LIIHRYLVKAKLTGGVKSVPDEDPIKGSYKIRH